MVHTRCPHCGASHDVSSLAQPTHVRCLPCGGAFTVAPAATLAPADRGSGGSLRVVAAFCLGVVCLASAVTAVCALHLALRDAPAADEAAGAPATPVTATPPPKAEPTRSEPVHAEPADPAPAPLEANPPRPIVPQLVAMTEPAPTVRGESPVVNEPRVTTTSTTDTSASPVPPIAPAATVARAIATQNDGGDRLDPQARRAARALAPFAGTKLEPEPDQARAIGLRLAQIQSDAARAAMTIERIHRRAAAVSDDAGRLLRRTVDDATFDAALDAHIEMSALAHAARRTDRLLGRLDVVRDYEWYLTEGGPVGFGLYQRAVQVAMLHPAARRPAPGCATGFALAISPGLEVSAPRRRPTPAPEFIPPADLPDPDSAYSPEPNTE